MIVVLGADGLLGSHLVRRFPTDVIGFSHHDLDITNTQALGDALYRTLPDAVINCAGRVPKVGTDRMVEINAEAPHYLARLGDQLGFKLVHVSTDCVFKLDQGNYVENSPPLAETVYGRTKSAGEIRNSPPHLTVRTSFVGYPDPKGRGLLAWLANSQGQRIQGYRGVKWNGLTTTALADALYELAYDRTSGVRHLFGETITKYDILKIVSDAYEWEIDIEPVDFPVQNATLATMYNDCLQYLPVTDFREQVDMMIRAGE